MSVSSAEEEVDDLKIPCTSFEPSEELQKARKEAREKIQRRADELANRLAANAAGGHRGNYDQEEEEEEEEEEEDREATGKNHKPINDATKAKQDIETNPTQTEGVDNKSIIMCDYFMTVVFVLIIGCLITSLGIHLLGIKIID